MTEDQTLQFDEFTSLNERAARAEREAVVLGQQLADKNAEAAVLRARAQVIAKQLGLTS